jgi:DNA polymerase-3 subunit epsilon
MSIFFTGFDLESTGLHWEKGDRIIEMNLQVWRWEDRKRVINWTSKISNDGQPINRKAQEVHGIAAVDLIGAPKFADVAEKIDTILSRSSAIVAHNGAGFDGPFLAHEMGKVGRKLPDIFLFDTMIEGMFASYDTKPPSLQELCWAMDVEYDPAKAHAAEYDVEVMMQSFFNAVDLGYFDVSEIINAKEAA